MCKHQFPIRKYNPLLLWRHKIISFSLEKRNQATQEFTDAQQNITSYPHHWLACTDAASEQVILVQPVSSALQRHS